MNSRGVYALIGGKGKLQEQISYYDYINECPVKCKRFAEPCVGAGNITSLVMGKFDEVIINDNDIRNINVYWGLRDYFEDVLKEAYRIEGILYDYKDDKDKLNRTWNKICMYSKYRRGTVEKSNKEDKIKVFACALVYKNYVFNGTNSRSKNSSHGNLSAQKVKKGDLIWNRHIQLETFNTPKIRMGNVDVIKFLDCELENTEKVRDTFYFIDPPYLGAKVGYPDYIRCTGEEFHKQLCEKIRQLDNVMLCGFESELYKRELEDHGFYKTFIGEKQVSASSKSGERRWVKEFIWTSYPV